MIDKFPIGQSFQRLNDCPLDATTVFDTLAQAQDYAKNNPTAYRGQIIHVKDARTDKEIESGTFVYEESCFINSLKDVEPICSFTYEAMGVFFDLMYEILDGPTEETKNKLDTLKEIMYDNYTYGYIFVHLFYLLAIENRRDRFVVVYALDNISKDWSYAQYCKLRQILTLLQRNSICCDNLLDSALVDAVVSLA